ncbi:polysaccharide biosynthesis/export family protein [Paraflavitalea pollutisoli]|uniref:polysaccharide biosynthesis/export family protein n=1 Tax=Paraflavitalea pollutisoli TaxID=3034143 RepID=UPI0023ECD8E0|nr:polysaccharide biosynthesis/export family protein [Paraflavitalea sp. H1-2-19X]
MQRLTGFLLVVFIIVLGCSCGNVKNLQYVQGAFDTVALSKVQFVEPVIQKGDLLSIALFSDNPVATSAVIRQQGATPSVSTGDNGPIGSSSLGSATTLPTYLVSQTGEIQLFKLGTIKVEGWSKDQLADTLEAMYAKADLLKNPYVEVRLMNYKITLIGEVTRPGTYSIPTEKVNIFEALGLAGDITVYGKRNNVMVVRESKGKREFQQLDLSKPEVFGSPYYYLQPNDMVIVDVAKNKGAVNDQITVRNITVAASVLSTIAIFINIFSR